MEIKVFVNNPWEENTLLLYDETKEAVVIDCGCFNGEEELAFMNYLSEYALTLKKVLNTHLHIDHVLGNNFIRDTYNLSPEASREDDFLIHDAISYARMLGLSGVKQPPATGTYLKDGDTVRFGKSELKVIAVPGHSPGGLCFYSEKDKLLIAGDVLFAGSVGRSDLPGGDGRQLVEAIRAKLFVLPEDVVVIPGHGPSTTIGHEKKYNPFF